MAKNLNLKINKNDNHLNEENLIFNFGEEFKTIENEQKDKKEEINNNSTNNIKDNKDNVENKNGFSKTDENLKDILKKEFQNKIPNIDDLLIFCTDHKCSDLYIKCGKQPYISRYGFVYKVPTFEVTNKIWNEWAKNAITSENNAKYVRQKMLDFSYYIEIKSGDANKGTLELTEYRYRVSAGFSFNRNIAAFRMISLDLPSFKKINFPKSIENILKDIAKKRNGITLFCGPTGSGKSTSLCACINDFTKNGGPFENSVFISLEDPIEYVIPETENVNITQKELGTDFKTFEDGIIQALREHPNFINVGETRNRETIEALVNAARTGHSVWSSFHSSNVADTISRLSNYLINTNPEIMYDLISNMNMILCQKLTPSENGFILNTQYMVFTDKIVSYLNTMIEENKNIPSEINKLFKNKDLIKTGLIKDWDK